MLVSPGFLTGASGRLFVLHATADGGGKIGQDAVLYLPPFAEEMNRSRRMAYLLARTLAEKGFDLLILDLFGTGDSEGDFEEARWETWSRDAQTAFNWLQGQGYQRICLVGLRLGALLALELAALNTSDAGLSKIVMWQPVLRGETYLTQFLRIRLAAGLTQEEEDGRETVQTLRTRLDQGETLEIAGYALTPEMASDIDALEIHDLARNCTSPLRWIELGSGPNLVPASRKILDQLGLSGKNVEASVVSGEPFWNIEETTLVPVLWRETAVALERP